MINIRNGMFRSTLSVIHLYGWSSHPSVLRIPLERSRGLETYGCPYKADSLKHLILNLSRSRRMKDNSFKHLFSRTSVVAVELTLTP
jgi:hypothetical protein